MINKGKERKVEKMYLLINLAFRMLQQRSGAPNDGFLLHALKTLFSLSRVLPDL